MNNLEFIYELFKDEIEEEYKLKKESLNTCIINENPGSVLWCYKHNLISLKAKYPLKKLKYLLENNFLSGRITLEINVLTDDINDLNGEFHTKTSPEDIQNGWCRFSIQPNTNNECVCNIEARFKDWGMSLAKWAKKEYKNMYIDKFYIDFYNDEGEPEYLIFDNKLKPINNF